MMMKKKKKKKMMMMMLMMMMMMMMMHADITSKCNKVMRYEYGDDDFVEEVEDDEYIDHWKPISIISNSILFITVITIIIHIQQQLSSQKNPCPLRINGRL